MKRWGYGFSWEDLGIIDVFGTTPPCYTLRARVWRRKARRYLRFRKYVEFKIKTGDLIEVQTEPGGEWQRARLWQYWTRKFDMKPPEQVTLEKWSDFRESDFQNNVRGVTACILDKGAVTNTIYYHALQADHASDVRQGVGNTGYATVPRFRRFTIESKATPVVIKGEEDVGNYYTDLEMESFIEYWENPDSFKD